MKLITRIREFCRWAKRAAVYALPGVTLHAPRWRMAGQAARVAWRALTRPAEHEAATRRLLAAVLALGEPEVTPCPACHGDGTCVTCGGDRVATWREGDHRALLHWGRCPAPELWRVEYQFHDTPQTWHRVMLALEDYARARTTRTDAPRHHRPSRVRLVRAPKDTAP